MGLTNFTAKAFEELRAESGKDKTRKPGTRRKKAEPKPPPPPVETEGDQPDMVLPENV